MSDAGKIILQWWSENLNRDYSRGKALSARLRRADAVSALCEPEVHALARDLELRDAARLHRIVSLLAEVRTHNSIHLARALGPGSSDPVLSKLRFERLIRARDDELLLGLRRAIPMAGRACNVAALGADLLYWGDQTRTRWCFEYFGAAAPNQISKEALQ